MDRLLFSAAKEQTQALPVGAVWDALCRRRERDRRLRRRAMGLAASAALLLLGFFAGRLFLLPGQGQPMAAVPVEPAPPVITIPKQEDEPASPPVAVVPPIDLPKTDALPEPLPGIIGVPKTDGGLVPVTLGDFSLPNLMGINSLSEMEFTWLPAGYTMEIADEDAAMTWLYDKDGEAALTFNLYHAQDDRPYDGDGLPPGTGRCTIKAGQDSGYLYSISWTLWLTEDVWVNAETSWLSLPDTMALMQGIVKGTGE